MKVKFETQEGKSFFLKVDQNNIIDNVKAEIENAKGIPKNAQSFIYKNAELENDKTFQYYSIQDGEFIRLFVKTKNGYIIFINFNNNKLFMPIEVQPTTTIDSIKDEIYLKKNILKSEQYLFDNFEELRNEKRIENYAILPNSSLEFTRKSKEIIIFILIFKDFKDMKKYFPINVEITDLVEDLKSKIQQIEGIPINEQKLIFAGKLFKDGEQLQKYDISSYSRVHLILKK